MFTVIWAATFTQLTVQIPRECIVVIDYLLGYFHLIVWQKIHARGIRTDNCVKVAALTDICVPNAWNRTK